MNVKDLQYALQECNDYSEVQFVVEDDEVVGLYVNGNFKVDCNCCNRLHSCDVNYDEMKVKNCKYRLNEYY